MRYRGQNFVTPGVLVLIAANVMIYIATSIVSGSFTNISYSLAYQYGISRDLFASQPWTIITSMFLHDGIFHILFNMVTLFYYGTYVVQLVGEAKFLSVYFIGGIIGNLFYLLLGNSLIPALGASGAIFALGGVLAVMRPKLKVVLFPIPIPMDLWIAVIGGFFVITFLGSASVAWQAHLGGLVTGLVAGYFFRRQEFGKRGWY